MKTSDYMKLFYAAMIAVPLLFVIETVSIYLGYFGASAVIEVLTAVGLVIYCTVGFAEVYSHRNGKTNVLLHGITVHEIEIRQKKGKGEQRVGIDLKRFSMENKRLESYAYAVKANRFTTVLDALI